jgi:hypothetical protein
VTRNRRGRSVHEHMVHQCVSENFWFHKILGVDVGAPPLPAQEVRWEFMARYAGPRRGLVGRNGIVLRFSAVARLGDDGRMTHT